MIFSAVFVVL